MRASTNYGATKGKMLALGVLLATLMAFLMLAAKPSHASTTFSVDSTADYGDVARGDGKCDIGTIMLIGERCTLRAAIQEANTKAVGSDAVLKVMLSGANAPSNTDGLQIGGSNSTVKGLIINRWDYGIYIDGLDSTGNRIAGNFIGTDPSGTQGVGNRVGVRFRYGSNNTLGGTSAAQRNVISGNSFSGVSLGAGDTTGNRVVGNYIGTDASGTKDLGNAHFGVNVDSVSGNTIGGT